MGEYEEIQTRKAISSYGGVGSIIETREGSIIIDNFDDWPFFQNKKGNFEEHEVITDKRFRNRLSKYFQKLKYLVKIPINELEQGYRPRDSASFLSARYFPEWFYCNNCKRFDKIDNWKKEVKEKHEIFFYPPKCYSCYVKSRDQNKRKKYYELEQVRFILTSPNGEIADIPWDKWTFLKRIKRENKSETKETTTATVEDEILSIANVNVPEDVIFMYKTSDKMDDLKGIWLSAENRKGEQIEFTTLSGIFNLRVKIQDILPNTSKTDVLFKPVIRSSNSVYYPNILSSIYIPASDELNEYTIKLIEENYKKIKGKYNNENISQMISDNLEIYNDKEIDPDTIQKLIDNNFSERELEIAKTENQYRFDEYMYIIEKSSLSLEDKLIFNKIDENYFQKDLIKSIYKMDKIKFTSVQTSYTRQEPLSINSILEDEDSEKDTKENIVKKFTSKYGKNTKYLPAIDSFGEGIFFEFDAKILDEWINSNTSIVERITILQGNKKKNESTLDKYFDLNPKYVLIHTFSHLIIKELEYLCGYPSTSMQERLYIDEELRMNGVLIYTIAGSEGSYGGITSICDDDRIRNLIESAMKRAKDCATDPICYHTQGQGVANLNLSACFSCTLLPETSCEKFNCYLDRRILIDQEYGFFKELIN